MPIYAGVSGANRQVTKVPVGVSGANRNCKSVYAGASGTNRQVFASNNMSNISNASGLGGGGNGKISCSGNVITVISNLTRGSTSDYPTLRIKGVYDKPLSIGEHTAQITISDFTCTGNGAGWVWASIRPGNRSYKQSYDPTCEAIVEAGGKFTYTFTFPVEISTNEFALGFSHSRNYNTTNIKFNVLSGNIKIDDQPILYPDFSYNLTYGE